MPFFSFQHSCVGHVFCRKQRRLELTKTCPPRSDLVLDPPPLTPCVRCCISCLIANTSSRCTPSTARPSVTSLFLTLCLVVSSSRRLSHATSTLSRYRVSTLTVLHIHRCNYFLFLITHRMQNTPNLWSLKILRSLFVSCLCVCMSFQFWLHDMLHALQGSSTIFSPC